MGKQKETEVYFYCEWCGTNGTVTAGKRGQIDVQPCSCIRNGEWN